MPENVCFLAFSGGMEWAKLSHTDKYFFQKNSALKSDGNLQVDGIQLFAKIFLDNVQSGSYCARNIK